MKKLLLMPLLVSSLVHATDLDYMQDPLLSQLAQWPAQKPNVPVDRDETMFINRQQLSLVLRALAVKDKVVIAEIGSWIGASTRGILNELPNAYVIAIDWWEGSEDINYFPQLVQKLPTLYETFLVNCWDYKNRLIPLKMKSIEGLTRIHELGINPDLVYVDASHTYQDVLLDLETIYKFFPDTIMCGDDWSWVAPHGFSSPGMPVRRAVVDFCNKYKFEVFGDRNFWIIKK